MLICFNSNLYSFFFFPRRLNPQEVKRGLLSVWCPAVWSVLLCSLFYWVLPEWKSACCSVWAPPVARKMYRNPLQSVEVRVCATRVCVSKHVPCCWPPSSSSECRRWRNGGGGKWGSASVCPPDSCCDCYRCTGSSQRWQEIVYPEHGEKRGGEQRRVSSLLWLHILVKTLIMQKPMQTISCNSLKETFGLLALFKSFLPSTHAVNLLYFRKEM